MNKLWSIDLLVRTTRAAQGFNRYIETEVNLLQNKASRPIYMRFFKRLKGIPICFLWPFKRRETLVGVKYLTRENVEETLIDAHSKKYVRSQLVAAKDSEL